MDPVPDMNRTMRPDVDVRNCQFNFKTYGVDISIITISWTPERAPESQCDDGQ